MKLGMPAGHRVGTHWSNLDIMSNTFMRRGRNLSFLKTTSQTFVLQYRGPVYFYRVKTWARVFWFRFPTGAKRQVSLMVWWISPRDLLERFFKDFFSEMCLENIRFSDTHDEYTLMMVTLPTLEGTEPSARMPCMTSVLPFTWVVS